MKADEKQIHGHYGKLQVSFFHSKYFAANTHSLKERVQRLKDGLPSDVVAEVCTEWCVPLFEVIVRSS